MTDTEIIRACAEAMGWTPGDASSEQWRGPGWYGETGWAAPEDWNPLSDDTACMQVFDEFGDSGFDPSIRRLLTGTHGKRWLVGWTLYGQDATGIFADTTPEGRRWAIVVGFLNAKGLWKEEK